MNCPHCGLELDVTTWNRYFCKNCGIINIDEEPKDKKDDSPPDYVG